MSLFFPPTVDHPKGNGHASLFFLPTTYHYHSMKEESPSLSLTKNSQTGYYQPFDLQGHQENHHPVSAPPLLRSSQDRQSTINAPWWGSIHYTSLATVHSLAPPPPTLVDTCFSSSCPRTHLAESLTDQPGSRNLLLLNDHPVGLHSSRNLRRHLAHVHLYPKFANAQIQSVCSPVRSSCDRNHLVCHPLPNNRSFAL